MSQPENEHPAELPDKQEPEEQPSIEPESETLAVSFSADEILGNDDASATQAADVPVADSHLLAVLEAIIYVTDEPLTLDQIAEAIQQPRERVAELLDRLCAEYDRPERGLSIREVAGGFRMT